MHCTVQPYIFPKYWISLVILYLEHYRQNFYTKDLLKERFFNCIIKFCHDNCKYYREYHRYFWFTLYKKLWKMESRSFIIKLFYTMKLFCQPTFKIILFCTERNMWQNYDLKLNDDRDSGWKIFCLIWWEY